MPLLQRANYVRQFGADRVVRHTRSPTPQHFEDTNQSLLVDRRLGKRLAQRPLDRNPHVRVVGIPKSPGHHTDDTVVLAIDEQRLTNRRRRPRKAPVPEAMAQDDGRDGALRSAATKSRPRTGPMPSVEKND